MSWFRKKSHKESATKLSVPSHTDSNQASANEPSPDWVVVQEAPSREKQITQLLQQCQGVQAANAQRTSFDVPLAGPAQHLRFQVVLPPGFPQEAPRFVFASVRVQHELVDLSGHIQHRALQSWTAHTSLAQLVNEVRAEFAQKPPQEVALQAPSGYYRPVQPVQPTGQPTGQQTGQPTGQPAGQQPVQPEVQQKRQHHIPAPPVPPTFDELQELSVSRLRKVLTDERRLADLCAELDVVRQLYVVQAELYEAVGEISTDTLEKREQLDQARAEYDTARTHFDASVQQRQELLQRHRAVASRTSPAAIAAELDAAVDASDALSEELLDDFLGSDEGSLTAFLKQYKSQREKLHNMQIMRERIDVQTSAAGDVVQAPYASFDMR
ncbi:MAG: hypothetical protein MHM6MM_001059 [Cercozoa sp. M6MM]